MTRINDMALTASQEQRRIRPRLTEEHTKILRRFAEENKRTICAELEIAVEWYLEEREKLLKHMERKS